MLVVSHAIHLEFIINSLSLPTSPTLSCLLPFLFTQLQPQWIVSSLQVPSFFPSVVLIQIMIFHWKFFLLQFLSCKFFLQVAGQLLFLSQHLIVSIVKILITIRILGWPHVARSPQLYLTLFVPKIREE